MMYGGYLIIFFCFFFFCVLVFFFFQAEDGIRDLVRSRGLGDVYKRQVVNIILNLGFGINVNKLKPDSPCNSISRKTRFTVFVFRKSIALVTDS